MDTPARDRYRAEVVAAANDDNASVGDLSDEARLWLYSRHVHEMPAGVAKARTGDPDEWLDLHALPEYKE